MSQQVEPASLPYRSRTRLRAADAHIRTIIDTHDMEHHYSDLYAPERERVSRDNPAAVERQGSRPRRRVESGEARQRMMDASLDCEEQEGQLSALHGGRESVNPTPSLKCAVEDGSNPNNEEQAMFSCNICYEMASDPVVTLCGHLYCWPCLYKWLQMRNNLRTCPVCKAGVDRDKVIPVYGRGGNGDPRLKKMDEVPLRPSGQRPAPVDSRAMYMGSGQHGMQLPSLFGLTPGSGRYGEYISPEQHHQAFLSRLLLMLGSFVIMCLLLF